MTNPLYAGTVPERFAVHSFTAAGSYMTQADYLPQEQRGGLSVQFSSDSGFIAKVYTDNGVGAWADVTSLVCGVATVTALTGAHFFAAHFFPWKTMVVATAVGSNLVVSVGL